MTASLLNLVLAAFMKFAVLALAIVVAAYLPKLRALIEARVTNQTARDALIFVSKVIGALVAAKAEEVRDLKDPSTEGNWTPARARHAMQEVIDTAKLLAPQQVAILAKATQAQGVPIEVLLRQMGEAEVELLRRNPTTASLAAPLARAITEASADKAPQSSEKAPSATSESPSR